MGANTGSREGLVSCSYFVIIALDEPAKVDDYNLQIITVIYFRFTVTWSGRFEVRM